jgi:hypothetical protein
VTDLWSAEELALHEFEDPTYLIEPLVPLGGVFLLHGKRGVGKTQFAMSIANSIINGAPLFGRWPVLKGPVVYIQTDMTPQIQQLRVQKVVEVLNLDGLFFAFPQSLDIVGMHLKDSELVQSVRDVEPVLVVWDTLRRSHHLNEDDSASVQLVYSSARRLFPGVTHLFIHHDKKSPADPTFKVEPEEQFRGSGDWIDSADCSAQLRTQGTRSPRRIGLLFHKARTTPDFEKRPVLLEMDLQTMLLLPALHGRGHLENAVSLGLSARRDTHHKGGQSGP